MKRYIESASSLIGAGQLIFKTLIDVFVSMGLPEDEAVKAAGEAITNRDKTAEDLLKDIEAKGG